MRFSIALVLTCMSGLLPFLVMGAPTVATQDFEKPTDKLRADFPDRLWAGDADTFKEYISNPDWALTNELGLSPPYFTPATTVPTEKEARDVPHDTLDKRTIHYVNFYHGWGCSSFSYQWIPGVNSWTSAGVGGLPGSVFIFSSGNNFVNLYWDSGCASGSIITQLRNWNRCFDTTVDIRCALACDGSWC